MDRVMGLETEYAAVWQGEGERPTNEEIFKALAGAVLARLGTDAPVSKSLFLPNGGRLYFDDEAQSQGNGLIEWATPECRNAADVTLYELAGERLLSEAVLQAQDLLGGQITLLKNNTDGHGHTYGCHENYLVPRYSEFIKDDNEFYHFIVRYLVPFLVTRQILCGAGQLGVLRYADPQRTGYQISQRADFIASVVSEDARRYRPIINTRDETHANPARYRRLHILVGDSNMSAWCTCMKLGMTSLVLDSIEALPSLDFVVSYPVMALRSISYNDHLTNVQLRKAGHEVEWRALDIQQFYLDLVKNHFAGEPAESETAGLIGEWEEALNTLGSNFRELGDRVDWVTKYLLIEEEKRVSQVAPDDASLAHINLRYHDINPNTGLFSVLLKENAVYYGPLADQFKDTQVERALHLPPATTRARVRGEFVKWCWAERSSSQADWAQLVLNGQTIAVPDPLDFFSEPVYRAWGIPVDPFTHLQDSLLSGESADVRARAARLLAQLPVSTEERIAVLARGLQDPEWQVRVQVVQALIELQPDSRVVLRQATQDRHVAVRRRAQAVLA